MMMEIIYHHLEDPRSSIQLLHEIRKENSQAMNRDSVPGVD